MGTKRKDYVINEENKDEVLNLLRNQDFITNISCEELEEIINNLDFKSLFNIIQNKSILDKIDFFRTNILEKDKVFFPNFLDTPTLVNKASYIMIYDMLNFLNSTQVLYYLICPYIREKLTNKEVTSLIYNKKISLKDISENDYLFNSIPSDLFISLVNKIWLNFPITTFISKKILKKLYNFSDNFLESIDLDEIAYLFETIKTKDNLIGQKSIVTVSSYKALIISYKLLGIKRTLEIIEEGNKGIDVDIVSTLFQNIINRDLTDYRDNNYYILHDIDKRILENVKQIDSNNKEKFTKKVVESGYLLGIVNLMLAINYTSFDNIINILYNVKLYSNNVNQENELSTFCNDFVNELLKSKRKELSDNLLKTAFNHFDLKQSIKETKYRKLRTSYLQKLKLKLFIRALKGDISSYAFKNNDIEKVLSNYRKMAKKAGFQEEVLIKDILIPLSKGKFDIYSYLNSYGITKPSNYDLYLNYQNDQELIKETNAFLKILKKKYKQDTLIEIINYICYGTLITSKVHRTDLNKIKELQNKVHEITSEFYINKVTLEIEKENNPLLNDDYEITNYIAIKDKIENFIKKTINYLNYHMNTLSIKEKHFKEFLRSTVIEKNEFSFTKANFSLIERTYSFIDLESIFVSLDIEQVHTLDKDLEELLFDKKILKLNAEGYLKGEIPSLGYLISNWDSIKKATQALNLDTKSLDIFDYFSILKSIQRNDQLISDTTLKSIYEDNPYYLVQDIATRINLTNEVFNKALTINATSIPNIVVSDDKYQIETLDKHSEDNFTIYFDTNYKIGASKNDLLCYMMLSLNAKTLVIKENNTIIGRINAIRRGNALFLGEVVLTKDIDIRTLLLEFANQIVNYTKDSIEPIEIVTLTNYPYGINVNSSICHYLNEPIDKKRKDYQELKKQGLIISDNINDEFSPFTTVIKSTIPLSKTSFKDYEAKNIYNRVRNDVIVINAVCSKTILKRINKIVKDACFIKGTVYQEIKLDTIKTIYLGNDFVILIDKDDNIVTHILPYDKRAIEEVNTIINNFQSKRIIENNNISLN